MSRVGASGLVSLILKEFFQDGACKPWQPGRETELNTIRFRRGVLDNMVRCLKLNKYLNFRQLLNPKENVSDVLSTKVAKTKGDSSTHVTDHH